MPRASHSIVARWAVGDGGLSAPDGSTISEDDALAAMPELGVHEVEIGSEAYEVERVGSRYCTTQDIVDYAKKNNDAFADANEYPDDVIWSAIQAAEEAIEDGTRRSFCMRARQITLRGSGLEELPEEDVISLSDGTEVVNGRQALASEPATVTMTYGAKPTESIRRACVKLAASFMRPRVGAENARGQSVEGVYISFELPTGADGSWTGLPEVDAIIERNRSRRVVIL